MIGKELSPVLKEIEETIWEFEANVSTQPGYTTEGFRGACKIFMSALMDKMWDYQKELQLTMPERESLAEKAGNDIRNLVKEFTNIDTHDLYEGN